MEQQSDHRQPPGQPQSSQQAPSNGRRKRLAVLLSIAVLILTYLTSRFNEFTWIVTGIGLVVAIGQWLAPDILRGGVHLGKLKDFLDFLKKRKFAIYLTILGLIMIGNILLLLGAYIKAPPSVTITSPADGSKVSRQVTVQGTASNIPQNEELWILVQPSGTTGYYPQPGPIPVPSYGKWSTTAFVGLDIPGDRGRSFTLAAVLADQEGSVAIKAKLVPPFNGLEPLPKGIQIISEVSVIRI